MPKTLQMMPNETVPKIKIEQSTFFGYSLSAHLSGSNDSSSLNGIITLTEKKTDKDWDIIILQTGTVSVLILENRDLKVINAISKIKELATNPSCIFILFNTWPSKKKYQKQYCYSDSFISNSLDNNDYCSPIMENLEQDIKLINESYDLVAQKNNLLKSNNRTKFYVVLTTHPKIELYEDDSHPNKYGSFLNACIFYQMLSDKKSPELKYNREIESKTAELLKQIAQ
jgi:hypothetical protein